MAWFFIEFRKITCSITRSEFWRQYEHLQLSDRQKKVINRLPEEGSGGFEGGITTKKYASMTHASKGTTFREYLNGEYYRG